MSVHVIQFSRLGAFAAEALSNIVRVTTLDITESASSQLPGLRLAAIGVHVRTINDQGHILACYLPVASVEIYEAVPRGSDASHRTYEAAWHEAEALKERVMAYLTEMGCNVSGAGVIHLHGVQPISATWPSDPFMKAQQKEGSDNGNLRLPQS